MPPRNWLRVFCKLEGIVHVQVEALLESGVDPAEKDSRGRTAYSLAGDKQIRDTFRRYNFCLKETFISLNIPSTTSARLNK